MNGISSRSSTCLTNTYHNHVSKMCENVTHICENVTHMCENVTHKCEIVTHTPSQYIVPGDIFTYHFA